MTKTNFHRFESVISYQFNDPELLIQALTHSSYANENKLKKNQSNERLEFLGDAVLELVTSDYLYTNYPKQLEGELTKYRASLVCEPSLAVIGKAIDIGKFLLLGKGEASSGGRRRASIVSDAVEALIGAIYLDGGIEKASDFIRNFLFRQIKDRNHFIDSKTMLQEYIQKNSEIPLVYKVIDELGPDHDKEFTVVVSHNGFVIGTGIGKSKKEAEQRAALDALDKMENED